MMGYRRAHERSAACTPCERCRVDVCGATATQIWDRSAWDRRWLVGKRPQQKYQGRKRALALKLCFHVRRFSFFQIPWIWLPLRGCPTNFEKKNSKIIATSKKRRTLAVGQMKRTGGVEPLPTSHRLAHCYRSEPSWSLSLWFTVIQWRSHIHNREREKLVQLRSTKQVNKSIESTIIRGHIE